MSEIPITCDGCGAVMHGSVCEYCGRNYGLNDVTGVVTHYYDIVTHYYDNRVMISISEASENIKKFMEVLNG